MFCPYIGKECNEECIYWSKQIQDCLKRLNLLERLNALSQRDKQKLTVLRKQ